jgi:hypothetical protein
MDRSNLAVAASDIRKEFKFTIGADGADIFRF